MFRQGLTLLLESASPPATVVGQAATSEEVLDAVRQTHPDVVVLDLSMPGRGGLDTIAELKRLYPNVKILVLTVHPEDHVAIRCLRLGADGYLTKEQAGSELVAALRQVAQHRKYIGPGLAERLALNLERHEKGAPHETLSDREFQVLLLIASGRTVSAIADELHLSVKTISTYRARILQKTGMRNNADLMLYAVRENLVPQP
jgi:DNA-binding NarL/FixJ family response regulator